MLDLSVVTPSFNMARFLPETLDSVARLATSHEHLVIDGGSTDGTVEILEGRADPALSWVSEPDRGQTHAVSKGLDRATGEFVGWLNADDAYVPQAVDAAVAHLKDNSDVAAVFSGLDIVDGEGEITRRYRPAPFNWLRYLYVGDYVPTPTIIFRRSLLAGGARLDEQFRDAADYDFYLRLTHGRRVDRLPDALVRFRYHAESKTAVDQDLQQREALKVRLRWARGRRDRVAMQAIDQAKQVAYRLVPPWPPRGVTRVVDAAYGARERLRRS